MPWIEGNKWKQASCCSRSMNSGSSSKERGRNLLYKLFPRVTNFPILPYLYPLYPYLSTTTTTHPSSPATNLKPHIFPLPQPPSLIQNSLPVEDTSVVAEGAGCIRHRTTIKELYGLSVGKRVQWAKGGSVVRDRRGRR